MASERRSAGAPSLRELVGNQRIPDARKSAGIPTRFRPTIVRSELETLERVWARSGRNSAAIETGHLIRVPDTQTRGLYGERPWHERELNTGAMAP